MPHSIFFTQKGHAIHGSLDVKRLGTPVVCTGLAGGRTGTRIVEELTAEAILNDFVRIGEESRTSTAVVDPTESSYTEINEWGPEVTEEDLQILREKLFHFARFDIAMIQNTMDVMPQPLYCTRTASRLARTYTDRVPGTVYPDQEGDRR